MTDETTDTSATADTIINNGSQVRLLIPNVFDGMAGVAQGVIAFIPNRAGKPSRREFLATVNDKSVRMAVQRCGESSMYAGTFYDV